ncbi:DUF6152 family protein [Gammaproteobacteria bacterium]|nr:DUF6152 family protein [Gammaproteobacteria bacterium]
MHKITRTVSILTIIYLLPFSAFAHHSFFGRFDTEASIQIEGDVTEVIWRNPHAYISVETKEQNGESVIWELETGSPTILLRAGIPANSIKTGDHIIVAGYPPLTNSNEIFATNILTPAGLELIMVTNAEPKWPGEKSGDYSYRFQTAGDSSRPELGLFRIWSHTAVVPFLFPESINRNYDLNNYPMTAAAKAAVERFDPATDNPTLNCTPKGMPTIMEQPYPMEIVQAGNNIVFRIEEYDLLRTIHMNQDSVPVNEPASALGYSIGHWDENTLIVTTTHLNWAYFNQSGIPQSEESVLLEKFTPSADGSTLDYELLVTDPVNFTEPVTLSRNWLYIPDEELLPFDCTVRE